jgi:nucleotide-binding universal stress UspA family protein
VLYIIDYGRFAAGGGNSGGTGWAPHLAEEPAKLLVDQGVERARNAAPDLQVTGEAKIGRPIGALIEASRTTELMIVGSRGFSELGNLVVGSVAAALAQHGRCPVVIVRGDGTVVPGPDHAVVVGVDGSASSQAALAYAAGTALAASAPLIVVTAWNFLLQNTWVGIDTRVVIDRDGLLQADRRAAQEVLDAAVERIHIEFSDVRVTGSLVEATPAAALVEAGANAGLIVVGARGHGAFMSFLLGSVSHAVVYASTRPVAVVRGDVANHVPDNQETASSRPL